ncbi:hypothetical protein [Hyperthermus butylicus]|uniref:Conserved crenarchaeal protein n=1 Tax=Hyperthermus butylicus (strain DSM 5456 / JCM 9403 / PLM1-5) TaxID=415426 RepID=A2BL49_HYPBU|nr:hypothetical protein [Hyperthermus butylicus]ABM80710.1 conserved crenarchaeal protein [Hyperthermus butylicus DSM 5456]
MREALGPVEAWLIRTRYTIGFVKGCFHPLPRLFYVPRIVEGSKTWREPWRLALKDPDVMVGSEPCLGGRAVPTADPLHVKMVSPVDAVRSLTVCERPLCRAALELLEYLESGGADYVGVTGGLAYNPDSASDIDLVVYGAKNTEKAYRILEELRAEGVTAPLHGLGHGWTHDDWVLHQKLAPQRLLMGLFRGYEYNVRLVDCTTPAPCKPLIVRGRLRVTGRIIGGSPTTTPAIYILSLFKPVQCGKVLARVLHVETFRLRYTEIPVKAVIEAWGVLEEREPGFCVLVPDWRGGIKLVSGLSTVLHGSLEA